MYVYTFLLLLWVHVTTATRYRGARRQTASMHLTVCVFFFCYLNRPSQLRRTNIFGIEHHLRADCKEEMPHSALGETAHYINRVLTRRCVAKGQQR